MGRARRRHGRRGQPELCGAQPERRLYDRYLLARFGSNRIASIDRAGAPTRAFTYDGAGNILTDTRNGVTTTYGYDAAGRLASVDVGGSGRGPYLYNGFGQLVSRTMTAGVPASTVHNVYDPDGNLLLEADAASGATFREYAWIGGRPLAVFDDVDSGNPIRRYVHVDHLDRPVVMTNLSGTVVWRASYLPFGEMQAVSGSASLDYRFPGQWFMAEVGLAYNWHRWYDAGLGRYTQPDPLGLEAGANRYVYARNSPLMYVDPDGRMPGLGDLWNKLFPGPKPDACLVPEDVDPEKCKELFEGIRSRIERMQMRYSDMLLDPHDLFDSARSPISAVIRVTNKHTMMNAAVCGTISIKP